MRLVWLRYLYSKYTWAVLQCECPQLHWGEWHLAHTVLLQNCYVNLPYQDHVDISDVADQGEV